jgi:hypothetical protein
MPESVRPALKGVNCRERPTAVVVLDPSDSGGSIFDGLFHE